MESIEEELDDLKVIFLALQILYNNRNGRVISI